MSARIIALVIHGANTILASPIMARQFRVSRWGRRFPRELLVPISANVPVRARSGSEPLTVPVRHRLIINIHDHLNHEPPPALRRAAARLHPNRVVGRHCHHFGARFAVAPRAWGGQAESPRDRLPEQPQATPTRLELLRG